MEAKSSAATSDNIHVDGSKVDKVERDRSDVNNEEQEILVSSLLALASEHTPAPINVRSPAPPKAPIQAPFTEVSVGDSFYLCGECSRAFVNSEECAEHLSKCHPQAKKSSSPSLRKPVAILPKTAKDEQEKKSPGDKIEGKHKKLKRNTLCDYLTSKSEIPITCVPRIRYPYL